MEQFEELQRLEPGYRDSEALLARARQELVRPAPERVGPEHGQPGVGQNGSDTEWGRLQHLPPLAWAGLLALALFMAVLAWLGPTPIPTPVPSPTMDADSTVYDNFDNPAYDGKWNPDLWEL